MRDRLPAGSFGGAVTGEVRVLRGRLSGSAGVSAISAGRGKGRYKETSAIGLIGRLGG